MTTEIGPDGFPVFDRIVLATPSRLAQFLAPRLWGKETTFRADPWILDGERVLLEGLTKKNELTLVRINAPAQVGKQVTCVTPMLTTRGWVPNGDLVKGDFVYGPDGNPTEVIQAHTPWTPPTAYRVTTTDGRHLDVNGEHLWTVHNDDWVANGGWKTLTTEDLLNGGLTRPNRASLDGKRYDTTKYKFRLPSQAAIQSPDVDLPIDPWLLGYWLGNGTQGTGSMTTGGWGDTADLADVEARLSKAGEEWAVTRAEERRATVRVTGLRRRLDALGALRLRHIPVSYQLAGTEQRLQLLRGLLDSDGYGGGGQGVVEFCSTAEQLAIDTYRLALSLGFRAFMSEGRATLDGKDVGPKWRVTFTVYDGDPDPFTFHRKLNGLKRGGRKQRCSIASITPIEPVPMRCITVDREDGLYLAGPELVPTHNSSYMEIFLPLWILIHFPHKRIVLVAYNDDIAQRSGALVRDIIDLYGHLFGITIDKQYNSKGEWKLAGSQGGMRSVGLGSSITGFPSDVMIIGDVIKNAEEASSKTTKEKHWREWNTTVVTRFQLGTLVAIGATRWADDDISGRIQTEVEERKKKGLKHDEWIELVYPAIAECPEGEDPETWRDRIGRRDGEPLQTRFSLPGDHDGPDGWENNWFYQLRDTGRVDEVTFAALYQQNPTTRGGGMFPLSTLQRYRLGQHPPLSIIRRSWDLAATEGAGDWTVGEKWGRDEAGNCYLLDVYRDRKKASDVLAEVSARAALDGVAVPIWIERERNGAGHTTFEFYKMALRNYQVHPALPEGKKEERWRPYSILWQQGKIYVPYDEDAPWVRDFISEHKPVMADGRRGRHDDQIDAAAHAINSMLDGGITEFLDGGVFARFDHHSRLVSVDASSNEPDTPSLGEVALIRQRFAELLAAEDEALSQPA